MKPPLLYKLRQDKTNSYAGLSKSVYVFLLAIFLMSGTKLLAQSFITEWAVNPTVKTLSFHLVTSGTTSYSWTAGSHSGSGTWSGIVDGLVKIDVAVNTTELLILRIDPDSLKRFYMGLGTSTLALKNVKEWGRVSWSSMEEMFNNCSNLNIIGKPEPPDLSNVTNMNDMFSNCGTNGPENIGDWDVSNVTNMVGMFRDAWHFNQPIGGWDVSNVEDMSYMFTYALDFNQPIGDWDVSNVKVMDGMFWNAKSFDQNINKWNVSNVTGMVNMFLDSPFNQPIGSWDVSNVTNMGSMFYSASNFNQPIGDWDVSKVTTMYSMFTAAVSFNQPIDKWDVSNVTNMTGMFGSASAFNQPIGSWDVSNVTNMDRMFTYASAFNQPIRSWDVSNVTDMSFMFYDAKVFNHPLGDWNLHNEVNMKSMLDYSGMDCKNYSATLIGWKENNPIVNGIILGAEGRLYGTNAVDARDVLVKDRGWVIRGDKPSGRLCDYIATDDSDIVAFNIYPNISTSYITIIMETNMTMGQVHITDYTGRIVGIKEVSAAVSDIDIIWLRAGMYFIRLTDQQGRQIGQVRKLVKM